MEQEILSARLDRLSKIIQDSLEDSETHSRAFMVRLLGEKSCPRSTYEAEIDPLSNEAVYGGYPHIASLGFELCISRAPSTALRRRFLAEINERLIGRSRDGLRLFSADDIAVLGIADGLAQVKDDLFTQEADAARKWLAEIINRHPRTQMWSSRMRDLAGDLLDDRGRLRTRPENNDVNARALELVLRNVWQEQFVQIPTPSRTEYKELLRELLTASPPSEGDLERAVIWLKAINLLLDLATEELLSTQNKEAISVLETVKANLDRKAQQSARRNLWSYIGLLAVGWSILIVLTYYLSWNVMEPWTYFIGIGGTLGSYIYFAVTRKEISPTAIYEQIVTSKRHRLYQGFGFDLEAYERAVTQVKCREN